MENICKDCVFCSITKERIVADNEHAFAILDSFPVSRLHTLIIPKRHVADYFGLTPQEVDSCNTLMIRMRDFLQQEDDTIEGFNIGMNCGEVAGQTIFHCHIHLIPRRKDDVENPRGGIRHLMPGKGYY